MFLGDAARPDVGAKVLQRFRIADPFERIAQRGFDKFEESPGRAAFCFHPEAQIFQKLWLEDGNAPGLRL